ncbi:MAG: porin [Gammaproteobacteria bacterium]|nr:porin [Gammaproteobacteria bacterium]MBU1481271.1 porin [Gammaproteobacteria bacterium]
MQKKIIALAIAAAFSAPAFAEVTVYGVVDATVASVSGDDQKSDMQALSGGLASSRIGVVTVEDLDNGMKAVAKVEYSLDTQTAGGVGNARQEMLALAGGFGTFATGYLQTTGYDWASKFDPTAGSFVSPLQSMTRGGGFLVGSATVAARAQRALAYISPDMSGVTVAVNYSTDTDAYTLLGASVGQTGYGNLGQPSTLAADMKVPAYLISVTYTGVPNLAVGGVIANLKADQIDTKVDDIALGASYDLGVVKLFGTYQTTKWADNVDSMTHKAMSLSAVAPVGPGAIAFSYAKFTADGKITGDVGANGMTLAYLQGLSKTTTLYAGIEKVSQGADADVFSVGNNALGSGSAAQGALVPGLGTLKSGGSSQAIFVGLNKKF